jgi:hypothetical protein
MQPGFVVDDFLKQANMADQKPLGQIVNLFTVAAYSIRTEDIVRARSTLVSSCCLQADTINIPADVLTHCAGKQTWVK